MKQATILVVDDEMINVGLVYKMLKDKYIVKVAYDGDTALKVAKKMRPDLILLDIIMPIMNGYEVAEKLQIDENTKDIPFIFLTSKQDSNSIIKGFKMGAVDYISKPFNREELLVRVYNHVNSYLLRKELIEQRRFIQNIMDNSPNMIIISDGTDTLFVNQTLLQFYNCKDSDDFREKYSCICDTFLRDDNYFHSGKVEDSDSSWIDALNRVEPENRIVSIMSREDFSIHAFAVSIKEHGDHKFLVSLNDISKTIEKQVELQQKTIHDKLTGSYNREYFDINYKNIIKRVKNSSKKLAVAILDIDHFKSVNDTYGHDVGDEILKELVSTVKQVSRSDDILIRWGGEEFVLLFEVPSEDGMFTALNHFRKSIEIQEFNAVQHITCSLGGTLYRNGEAIEKSIKRADEALYKSKADGRNRVTIS